MWKIFVVSFVCLATTNALQKLMNEEQLQAMKELAKLQCKENGGVGDDIPNALRDGNFSEDRNLKCFASCIFDHLHIAKKAHLLDERAIRHAYAMLPEHMQDEYVAGIEACKEAGEGQTDDCDFALDLAKCLHDKHNSNVKLFV